MPFDDSLNLNDDLTESDLQKLFNQADKAEKKLEKLKKNGGIFAEQTSNTAVGNRAAVEFQGTPGLSKQDRKIEKKIERLLKKVRKDEAKNLGKDKGDGFLSEIFGDVSAQNIIAVGKNPVAFLQNALVGLAGTGFAIQIADMVVKEIQRLDSFFKRFVDIIDNRENQLKDKQITAEIAAGKTQEILTTRSGNTEARDSYNTFNEFNNDRASLEDNYAVRNTSGYT